MTSTSQPNEPEGKSGSSPEKKPEGEPKAVPLGEFIELRQELRETKARLAALEGPAPTEKAKDSAAPRTPTGIDDLSKEVQRLANEQRVRGLVEELSLRNQKQGAAIAKLLTDMPGLTPAEAHKIAATRDPEAFKDGEVAEGAKAQFGSLTPRPGSSPEPVKEAGIKEHLAYAASLKATNNREARARGNNLAGHFLAEALGWEHKLTPVPKQ